MEKQKRERSSNFSAEETNLLISLIETKKSIIENKKSDATTWQGKEKAWKDIEKAFNSASGSVFRDHKHLKLKYEAIKRDTRKKSAMVQAECYKTGGGTSTAPPLTTVQEKVKSMILLSVEVNESQFDSDLVLPNSSKNNVIKQEDSEPPEKNVCVESQEETLLQSQQREKRPFDRLCEEKLEIAKIKKKLVTEELEQKLIRRKLLEKELEHKEIMDELEKQSLLLKIEILKKELGKKHEHS